MVFIKDFFPKLKDDIMRFISEFHCNCHLSKGINNTFIALIPKIDNLQRLNNFRPHHFGGELEQNFGESFG